MIWGNFLHIYQPPDQKEDTLDQIVRESYRLLVEILKKNPHAKLTLNINACLTEQLLCHGYKDLIEDIKALVKNGQIELTESAKYHAFLPLLPKGEIERQIILNKETNRKIFGAIYDPKGFHLPEMAYSDKVAKIIAKMGYSWVILNETSFKGKLFSKVDTFKVHGLKGFPGVDVLFRNRKLSDLIQRGQMWDTQEFYNVFNSEAGEKEYIITAMDGETFGHHRPGLNKFLGRLYQENKIKTLTVSEIIQSFPKGEEVAPLEGTWASMESELRDRIPYVQWKYPGNPIHKKQWELTNLAIKTVNKNKKDLNFCKARKLLDKALFSCQYWWAGAAPWWEIEYIEKGAYYLKASIIALKKISPKIKQAAEKLYGQIVFTAFDWERSGLAHKKSMEYTRKIIKELGEEMSGVSTLHSKK